MKIELSRKEEIILSLVISAIFGALWSGLVSFSYSHGGELSVLRNDLTIEQGRSVSAQSLREGAPISYVFPPPLYVFEWIEFEVNVYNASGGTLEINFTRDDKVLRTELVHGSSKIVLNGYGEHRLRDSNIDVKLRAINEDVRIGSVYISISRGTRLYNPLVGAFSFTLFVGITIILFTRRKTIVTV